MIRGKCMDSPPVLSSSQSELKSEMLDSVIVKDETAGVMYGSTDSYNNTPPQRNSVFDDLEAAETMVVQLLDIAASTADYLSSLAANLPVPPTSSHHRRTTSDADQMDSHTHQHHHGAATHHRHLDDKLKKNNIEYLDTIKQLHSLLLPHSHMVKAYETESYPTPTTSLLEGGNVTHIHPNMYTSKMELRLALEKHSLLTEFLNLEQEEKASTSCYVSSEAISNVMVTGDINEPILGKRKNID